MFAPNRCCSACVHHRLHAECQSHKQAFGEPRWSYLKASLPFRRHALCCYQDVKSLDRANANAGAITRAEQCVGVFEAEDALLSGAVVARTHAGATGGNYIDFQHVDEDFVEWTIPNCAAGRFRMVSRTTVATARLRVGSST